MNRPYIMYVMQMFLYPNTWYVAVDDSIHSKFKNSNFAEIFGIRKLESRASMLRYLRDPRFSRFATIPGVTNT